jgi:hypothetical protein
VGSSIRTRIRAVFLTRIDPRKKPDVADARGAGRHDGSGSRPAALLCFAGDHAGKDVGVSQSFVQLIGYVVLAAIILATGFGAL